MTNTPENPEDSDVSLPPIVKPQPLLGIPDALNTPVAHALETQFLSKIIQQLLAEMDAQPWWKKYSNTVMATVSGLVVLAGWITTTNIDLPQWATVAVGVILFVGSVLGIRSTKNGLTESVVDTVALLPESTSASTGRHHS